jgi:uncharacterized membrane protein YkvA (DUF1232 family)
MASTSISRPTDRWQSFRTLVELPRLVRLYWRLFRDSRVPLWPKALLVGALGYVVLPFDFIPDFLPIIGEVDDLVIVVLAAHWFMQACPPDVVAEHARALDGRTGA